jgi:hypothetical protein
LGLRLVEVFWKQAFRNLAGEPITMKRLAATFLLLLVGLSGALVSSGCVDPNPAYSPDPILPDQCRRGEEVSETFDSFERPHALDILVAVDNSGSVTGEQERLAAALPGFLDILSERGVSVRVGVVTADASSAPGLAPPATIADGCEENRAIYADSETDDNWKEIAACNVVQGDEGQPRQQALEVVARSISERPATLDDFFRDQARALVIVLSNEDDCSSTGDISGDDTIRNECVWNAGRLSKVDTFVDTIREEFSTPEGVSLAVFSGPPSEREAEQGEAVRAVCQGTLGAAYPANRLYEATQVFGEQGFFQGLCVEDFSFGLSEVADRLVGPTRTTLCPAERLVHEPLEVAVSAGGSEPAEVSFGEGGFLYFGPTGACENGAISLAAAPLEGAEAVEVRYCVDQ